MKFGLYGLVIAGVIGGTVAWADPGRTVVLKVDGATQKVHTSASTVRGVLSAAGFAVGAHDLVAPELAASIGNGGQVVVRRGHELRLVVNGKLKEVWVNAQSVDEALSQLGYDRRSYVSVSRSSRLDAGVTSLTVAAPKQVTIKADGKTRSVVTAGPTVAQALADSGVPVALGDRVSAKLQSPITNNEVIRVQRASYGVSVEDVAVPFTVVQQKDATAYVGTQTVVQQGQAGANRVTYQLVYLDGNLVGKVAEWSRSLAKPVSEVTKVGSKPAPAFVSSVPVGSAQAIAAGMVAARGWDASQFSCLVSLWTKESGWRTDAANPSGAYGIPQSLPGSKMASVGADWQTNPATQITWGLNYIAGVYGTPCAAWAHSQATNWY